MQNFRALKYIKFMIRQVGTTLNIFYYIKFQALKGAKLTIMNFIAQSSLTYLHKHLKLHKIMKKVWICRVVKFENELATDKSDISMVFSSLKKAEKYCNWSNKDNDQDSKYWMMYESYTICEHDFGEIPF